MLNRNQEPSLIEELGNKVTLLYSKGHQGTPGSSCLGSDRFIDRLEEYFKLRDNSRIPSVLHYVVLASIAEQYNLYNSNLEEDQVATLILAEMESLIISSQLGQRNSEVLIVGIQIIKSHYPILYQENKVGFFSIERASLEMLDSNPVRQVYYVEPKSPMHTINRNLFDFVDIQTQLQTQILDENIVIPKKNLRMATALSFCFGGGILFNVLSNNYLGSFLQNQINLVISSSKDHNQDKVVNTEVTTGKTIATSGVNGRSPQPETMQMNIGSFAAKDSVVVSDLTSALDTVSQPESLNLIKRFLENKPQLFAPPYNIVLASEIMTGKAYNDYLLGDHSNNSKEKSVEWLQNNGCYYQYGALLVQSIKGFHSLGDKAVLEVKQLEEMGLYDRKGSACQNNFSAEEKIVRYSLVKQNGIVKITGYDTLDQSRRKI
jgi:ARC6-like, IMS domain